MIVLPNASYSLTEEELARLNEAPASKEFGSPEYAQLMEQDAQHAAVDAMHVQ